MTKFSTDDLVGVILGFLKESKGDTEKNPYITKEGFAYLSGYCKGNNTLSLIEIEKYNQLVADYSNLIEKYEQIKTNNIELKKELIKHKKRKWFK